MAKVILKKSAVITDGVPKQPAPGDLEYGELALNYAVGTLYYKKSDNTIGAISAGGSAGNGTLTLQAQSGLTNTSVSIGTGTGFSANTATNTTYQVNVGPALTNLATTMTGAGSGFLRKSGADTYTVDTNTYATTSSLANYLPLAGGTMTGAISMSGTQTLTLAGFAGIEYYNTAGTWEVYIGTENNTGNVRYNSRQGTHTWYANGTSIGSLASTGLSVAGTLTHAGLVPSTGTGIDQVYTHQQSITLTTSWQDTGVNAAELATGSYVVQVTNVSDHTVGGGQYQEYYTGVMSWFAGNSNSEATDEIVLHRAGHAPNSGTIFLRVQRNPSPNLIYNGNFSLSSSGWNPNTPFSGGSTFNGSNVVMFAPSGIQATLKIANNNKPVLSIGANYTLTFTASSVSGNSYFSGFYITPPSTTNYYWQNISVVNGVNTINFTATSTDFNIEFFALGGMGTTSGMTIDDVVLQQSGSQGGSTDHLKLQIAGTTTNTAAYQYTFKFRRLI